MDTEQLLQKLQATYPHETLFLQAVKEVLHSVAAYWGETGPSEREVALLERLLVPERVIQFRVTWEDDKGALQHNTGYRVQFNSALGPYKGGLRFDPSVDLDTLKFLGFEQIFKNALTGLPLGGGKGGSDFNPKDKSAAEVRRFCRVFMLALHRELGIDHDVPAGDIGVGASEIGYMFGMYKEIVGRDEGVLTGKNELFGGSCQRTEATGHGVVYLAQHAAEHHDIDLAAATAVVSGAGNVAEYTARKLIAGGTCVISLSDRNGYLHKPDGFSSADVDAVKECKANKNNLDTLSIDGATYREGQVWELKADAYFPCATQNELDEAAAKRVVEHAKLIVEGANMPLTAEAQAVVTAASVVYVPGKAANAGGVAVSGLEMAQNASRLPWPCERVEEELQAIMRRIHDRCLDYGQRDDGTIDYVKGANIGGFVRVFEAMEKLGW